MNTSIIDEATDSADPLKAQLAFEEIERQLSSLTDPCERAALLIRKAQLYGVLHRFAEARKEISVAVETAPADDPDITFQAERLDALFYHEEQNPEEAFKRMNALLSKFGQHLQSPELRFIYEDIQQRRGFELAQLLRFEDAIPIFKECLMFEMPLEDRANVLTYLGICLSHLKRHEEARECLIEAANLGDMKEIRGLLHLQLGIVYFHLDCLQESKQELQQAVRYPNESRFSRSKVYGWLAAVSARLGERAEAENYTRLGNPS